MPKIYKVSVNLECPSDWDTDKVESFLRCQILTAGTELASLEIREIQPVARPSPGIYWVWYHDRWTMGMYDGEDWDVEGATFSYQIPVGPRWNVPDKPITSPIVKGPSGDGTWGLMSKRSQSEKNEVNDGWPWAF